MSKICSNIEYGQDRSKKTAMQASLREQSFCEWPMRRQGELAVDQEKVPWGKTAQLMVRVSVPSIVARTE